MQVRGALPIRVLRLAGSLVLASTVAGAASALTFDDGRVHDVGGEEASFEDVLVVDGRNGKRTTLNVHAGAALGCVDVLGSSRLNLLGGVVGCIRAAGSSTVSIEAGGVIGEIEARAGTLVEMSGGTVLAISSEGVARVSSGWIKNGLAAFGSADVEIRGGTLGSQPFDPFIQNGFLWVINSARVRVFGSHFETSPGGIVGFLSDASLFRPLLNVEAQASLEMVEQPARIPLRAGDLVVLTTDGLVRLDLATRERRFIPSRRDFQGIAVDGRHRLFLLDVFSAEIVRMEPELGTEVVLASGGLLERPLSLAIDPRGDVLVSEAAGRMIVRVDSENGAQSVESSDGLLTSPTGLSVSPAGDIFVLVDSGTGVVEVDGHTGAQRRVADLGGFSGGYSGGVSLGLGLAIGTSPEVFVIGSVAVPFFLHFPALFGVDRGTGAIRSLGFAGSDLRSAIVVDSNGALIFGDREGWVGRLDPETGERERFLGLFRRFQLQDAIALVPDALRIEIDVRSSRGGKVIARSSRGYVRVAVLGSSAFDAARIDADALWLGPAGAKPDVSKETRIRDVNGDGYLDWVARYRTAETGIGPGEDDLCVVGRTADGDWFRGCEQIATVPAASPSNGGGRGREQADHRRAPKPPR